MVTVAERIFVVVLTDAVSVTEPEPVPPDGVTVSQLWLLDAVHGTAGEVAVTVTARVPPAQVTLHVVGDSVRAAPACVTVTDLPATVTVAVRDDVDEFGPAVSVTVPVPTPPTRLSESHAADDEADHAAEASEAVTVTA